jgi:hypothetical protein
VPIVLKSESLNFLEPSGPAKACNGIALLCFCLLLLNIHNNNNEKTLLLFRLMLCSSDDDSCCRKSSEDKMYKVQLNFMRTYSNEIYIQGN